MMSFGALHEMMVWFIGMSRMSGYLVWLGGGGVGILHVMWVGGGGVGILHVMWVGGGGVGILHVMWVGGGGVGILHVMWANIAPCEFQSFFRVPVDVNSAVHVYRQCMLSLLSVILQV